ncbi:hypothetical protein NMG60_11026085 [Bertholletia excelsa]
MNAGVRTILHSINASSNPQKEKKVELRGNKSQSNQKAKENQRRSNRERKLALLEDVDKLKKKLRHEENVHRALKGLSVDLSVPCLAFLLVSLHIFWSFWQK